MILERDLTGETLMAAISGIMNDRGRWNGSAVSSGGLARVYGFRDLDGSQPDCWRYMTEVVDAGKPADAAGYR